MKIQVVQSWCDGHLAEGEEQVEATIERRVVVAGYEAKDLDLCEACDKELLGRLLTLLGERPAPAGKRPVEAADENACTVCGNSFTERRNLLAHVWTKHAPPGARSQGTTVCPECGQEFSSTQGTRSHRYRAHNVDALADAYAAAREAS